MGGKAQPDGFCRAACLLLTDPLTALTSVLLGSEWLQKVRFKASGCFPLHFLSLLPWGMSVCSLQQREGPGEGQVVTGRATTDRSQSSKQGFCEHQRSWKGGGVTHSFIQSTHILGALCPRAGPVAPSSPKATALPLSSPPRPEKMNPVLENVP